MGHSLWPNVMPHTIGHGVGTQESVANVNAHPSYIGYSMWPDIVQANMAQGRSVFPCSPTLCPTGTSMPQSRPYFPSSQSNMASIFNDHGWRDQSTIADSQVWGGGQSSFLEQSQGKRRGVQQSYLEMMNATDND